MNVASLELCKELYELSGWKDTYLTLRYGETSYGHTPIFLLNKAQLNDGAHGKHITETDLPAYELGYLLRKIPPTASDGDHWSMWQSADGMQWGMDFGDIVVDARTPENAAAKLCRELFKQGVLTK